jgi:hypothetical protein
MPAWRTTLEEIEIGKGVQLMEGDEIVTHRIWAAHGKALSKKTICGRSLTTAAKVGNRSTTLQAGS